MDGDGASTAERKAEATSAALTGTWRPSSVDVEARTAEVVFSSGADVVRYDPWTGRQYVERLEISDDAVNLSRLRAGAPLLDSHERGSVRNTLGVVEDAWISGNQAHARVRFSERADDVFADVASGILRKLSVGYSQDEVRITENDNGPDLHEVVRWSAYELSFVAVPADNAAEVRSQPSYQTGATDGAEVIREDPMNNTNGAARVPQQAAEQRERARASYILDAGEKLNQRDLAKTLIGNGTSIEEASRKLIDAAAAVPSNDEEIDHHISLDDGKRGADFANAAAEGLLVRERILKDTKTRDAREFVDASFADLAEHTLRMGGVDTRSLHDKPSLFKRAFITSTTLADTLATFSTRALMSGYEAVPRTFVDAFRESVSRNFKANERIRVSDTPALAAVAEGSNFQEVTLSDRKETFTVAKYGHILKYTIEAMVNDDLGAIGREAERAGFAAGVTESNVFWSVVTTNANMSDSAPIFDAGESNLVSAVALTADALEDAREYFRTVTTENSVKLNLQPRFLFVSPDLERVAEKLVSPPVNHATATLTDVLSNAYASQLELRVESRLPAGDWMLAADFRQVDTLEYAWLEGRRGAFVEQDGDFDSMGIKFRVADIFGAGAVDRRGVYYNDAA